MLYQPSYTPVYQMLVRIDIGIASRCNKILCHSTQSSSLTARRDNGKRFVVRADEKLTALPKLNRRLGSPLTPRCSKRKIFENFVAEMSYSYEGIP
jgi:hypothetical protein